METQTFVRQETMGLATLVEQQERGIPFGRFLLLDRIASGGMGEIFLGRQRGVGGFTRLIAVKRILQHYTTDKNHVRMFFDEARLQSLLSDRHVVQIHDMGECDEHLFIAMEYVHGVSLRRLTQKAAERGLALHPAHVCDLAVQAFRGLSYAHNVSDGQGRALHIVHRDVNPQNVLVSFDGEVKLIDFGIAKSEMSAVHTETGTLKGKLTYMSPEQARGEKLDRRSDLFSMGICVYEMLAAKNPFERGNVILSLQAIEADDVPVISTVRPDAVGFDAVLAKIMAKDRETRFNDGVEVVNALVEDYTQGAFGEAPMPLADFLQVLFADEIKSQLRRLEELGVSLAIRQRPENVDLAFANAHSLEVEVSDPSRKLPRSRSPTSAEGSGSSPRITLPAPASVSVAAASDNVFANVAPLDLSSSSSSAFADAGNGIGPITEPTSSGVHPATLQTTSPSNRPALLAGVLVGAVCGGAALLALAILPDILPNTEILSEPPALVVTTNPDPPTERDPSVVDVAAPGETSDVPVVVVVDPKDETQLGPPDDPSAPGDAKSDDLNAVDAVDVAGDVENKDGDRPDDKSRRVDRKTKPRVDDKNTKQDRRPTDVKTVSKPNPTTEKPTPPVKPTTSSVPPAKPAEKPVDTAAPVVVEKPTAPVKFSVRASAGYTIEGAGMGGNSGTTTVDGGVKNFRLTKADGLSVSVQVRATDGGAQVTIDSAPFAIVRVDSMGRGRTPRTVSVDAGAATEIFLKSPQGGELTLIVKAQSN